MDRSPEARAASFFQRGLYPEALQAYTLYLNSLPKTCKPEQHIAVLFNRSACYLKLKQFHKVVEDCNLILCLDNKHEKALGRKVKAMCSLGQFSEAQSLAHQWIQRDPTNYQARKELERLNVIVKALSEQDNEEDLEMDSTVEVSPQHGRKDSQSSPPHHNLSNTNVWSVGSPLAADTPQRSLNEKVNSMKKLWGGFEETMSSSYRNMDTRDGRKLGVDDGEENNWGVAVNTSWDNDHNQAKKSNTSRPVVGLEPHDGLRNVTGSPPSDNTHLVWSTNILTGPSSSPQSGVKKQNASETLHPQLQQQNTVESMSKNILGHSAMNGRMAADFTTAAASSYKSPVGLPANGNEFRRGDVALGNGSVGTTSTAAAAPALWMDPPKVDKDYASLWTDPDPFNCRQKGQSPPWQFTEKKKSRFSFANEATVNAFDAFPSPDNGEYKSDDCMGEPPPSGVGFPPVTVVESFSKSLVSTSTHGGVTMNCRGSGLFNGATPAAISSTDKLFLQHMQRNTGGPSSSSSAPQLGKIQGNNYSPQPPPPPPPHKAHVGHHPYGPVGDSTALRKAISSGEDNEELESMDDQNKSQPGGNTTKPSIPQAFIPHVVQAQLIMGHKQEPSSLSPASKMPVSQEQTEKDLYVPASDGSKRLTQKKTESSGSVVDPTEKQDIKVVATTEIHHSTQQDIEENRTDVEKSDKVSAVASSAEKPRVWRWRPPPRGLTSQEYSKCPRFVTYGLCSFGENCSQAHSDAELAEWKERFEERKKELIKKKEEAQDGSSYVEKLMEKLMKADDEDSVMTENLEHVNVQANCKLSMQTPSKKYSHTWLFTVTSKLSLKKFILIDDNHRKHFHIMSITSGSKKAKKNQKAIKLCENCQDWDNPDFKPGKAGVEKVYKIKVSFSTEIFGTFRQSMVFDFDSEPVLVRQLCVDSCPITDLEQLTKDLTLSETGRWDLSEINVVEFAPKMFTHDEDEKLLLETYPVPTASQVAALSESLLDPTLSQHNYRHWMHNLLYIEEIAQFSSIAKFNVSTELQVVRSFMLMPNTAPTAKYAQNGELYGRLELTSVLSEDTAQGRLILQNVYTVYLAKSSGEVPEQQPDKVYEALIEEKGKNFIMLRLSKECVKDLHLKSDHTLQAQIQFQLNRMPICEMHMAVDELPGMDIVFPSPESLSVSPWTQDQLNKKALDGRRLNEKQKEAVSAITVKTSQPVSPVLIVGPYGTGKTYTLAQAAKEILKQEGTRVLICTHSNSAADLYIRDYFHPYVVEGHHEAIPLRIYYRHRWVQTVNTVTLQYCLTKVDPVRGTQFVNATKEDVEKRRVIVATFSTARQLYHLDLPDGFFTHILLDEAAQALECETIMPLVLANENTRVVLAGDHMQLSPEVHSEFARDRSFQMSFVERLYHYYPQTFACKIMLCENYRSHKDIVDLTSELFYNSHLRACGNQSVHDRFSPLTFFTARGEDTQHQNSTGFFNNAEVYEVVDRVVEVHKNWPKAWGALNESSIGVVSPYADQVVRIRAELRKKKLHSVCVERVFNVQGKQFRVIFLSTVRTRHTCDTEAALEEYMDYGFLSNVKLLNTAITRAQSLVAVVGDPVSLCSIGKCRKLWERFIELCDKKQSLHGLTWSYLRAQLDGVELKKTYTLNPLAPIFVPNRLRHSQYTAPEPIAYGKYGYAFAPSGVAPAAPPMTGVQNLPSWMSPTQRQLLAPHLMQQQPVMNPANLLMNPATLQYLNNLQGGGAGGNPDNQSQNIRSILAAAAMQPPPPPGPSVRVDPASGINPNLGRYLHHQQTVSPKSAATGSRFKQENTRQVLGEPDKREHTGGASDVPAFNPAAVAGSADFLAAQMRGQTLHHMTPVQPAPHIPHPQQQQQQAFNQQQAINQTLMAASAVGFNPFLLPPNLLGMSPFMGVNTVAPPYQPLQPGQRGRVGGGGENLGFMQPPAAGGHHHHHALPPQQHFLQGNTMSPSQGLHTANVTPPLDLHPSVAGHYRNRSLQSPNLRVSPASMRSGSQSPSRRISGQQQQTPKMEFLPKAVNVRSPPSNLPVGHASSLKSTADGGTLDGTKTTATKQTVISPHSAMRNPFLQRELYGYIMQTEGHIAAQRFVSAQAQQLPNSFPEDPYAGVTRNLSNIPRHTNGFPADPPANEIFMNNQTVFDPQYGQNFASPGMNTGPRLPSKHQFLAQDLERQWQEESLRGQTVGSSTSSTNGETLAMTRAEYKHRRGATRQDDKLVYNPNFEAITEKFLIPKRQSPFGEGPQPYSRQKLLGGGEVSTKHAPDKNNSIDDHYGCARKDQDSLTSPLSVEIFDGILEKELGQIHIDSPVNVADLSSPNNNNTRDRNVPLYMRRVQAAAAAAKANSNASATTEQTASPPRLSYAGALRHVENSGENEDDTPLSAPLTKGPYTPEVNPFFIAAGGNEQDADSLLLLRNLSIK